MRIPLAALATATLFVMLGPRPLGEQAHAGIPLGDLVRVRPSTPPTTSARPEVPTQANPTISQLSPSMGGTSTTANPSPGTSSETFLPTPPAGASNLGATPSTSVGGTSTPGLNPTSPGLPPTTPEAPPTTGGVPPTTGVPPQSTMPPSSTTLPGSGR